MLCSSPRCRMPMACELTQDSYFLHVDCQASSIDVAVKLQAHMLSNAKVLLMNTAESDLVSFG